MTKSTSPLKAQNISVNYDTKQIIDELNIDIPAGSFTVIVGPNGCGKSTLLRSLSRLLKPKTGQVILNGQDIQQYASKEVARQLGLLPQSAIAPDGISVAELVSRGRYPHQSLFKPWSQQDDDAVAAAMEATGVTKFANLQVDQLSGGQRQCVWVAMALAQETPLLLLDEPTTYLDIAHQIELLELFTRLNKGSETETPRTLVAVLHDLNHACRYADHMIAMRNGAVVAEGSPSDIVTAELVEEVFGLPCIVIDDPVSGTPLIVPLGSHQAKN